MATIDMNRTTSISLPGAVSSEIWQKTQEGSAVMRLARKIELPGLGVTIPVITGDPEAGWVGETEKKPVKRGTLATKQMTPYTLAVIVPFSNQFKRDLPNLYDALIQRLPLALGKKFDQTVFGGNCAEFQLRHPEGLHCAGDRHRCIRRPRCCTGRHCRP